MPEYESGQKIPFDKPSVLLAQQNNLTVVLVGQDFENLKRAMCGEEFEGTIIHP
jgi:uridylate kinase